MPLPGRPPTGVFISYRQEQATPQAGRLYDWLVRRFGDSHVFMDVDSIRLGVDFVDVIEEAVASCDALLALIGPGWADITTDQGDRRLDDPEDFVRIEIETALRRGIPVVPILLNGAPLPGRRDLPSAIAPLARRQACALADRTFRTDLCRLVDQLDEMLSAKDAVAAEPPVAPASIGRVEPPPPATVTAITRNAKLCVLEVRLSAERHLIAYRLGLLQISVELDGIVVGRYRSRYELTLNNGASAVAAVLEVKLSSSGLKIEHVTLHVSGVLLYED